MRKVKQHSLYFLIPVLLLLCIGCERTVEIDLPPHQPLLVLHGYVAVGDTVMVSLGKNMKIDVKAGDTATYVDNGWVVLYVNGVFADSLHFNPERRRYVSSHVIAQTGTTYKVKAGAPGFPEVEGEAKAPQTVPTETFEVKYNTRVTTFNSFLSDISFSFHDPPSETNYYLMELFNAWNATGCVYTYEPVIERFKGDLLPFEQNNCILSDEVIFGDHSFNGQHKKLTISAGTDYLSPTVDPLTGDTLKSYFKRYNISEDYYRYFKTWAAIEFTVGDISMASPVVIKGNIRNGYGLFTVFSAVTDTIP